MIVSTRNSTFLRIATLSLGLIACIMSPAFSQGIDGWPRTFVNADGSTTEIPAQPQRILSTSVTITGTLLAVDAPVIASGSAGNGRFFSQWADVANERGVENVWPAGSIDIEAIYAVEPDLIIVSSSGLDSAIEQIELFRSVAPTIILDYGGQTWQDLAVEIGNAGGLEGQVTSTIAAFDATVDQARQEITLPEGTASIISYRGPGQDNPIARAGGLHAQLLTALGFEIDDPTPSWHAQPNLREDFVWAAFENLVTLPSETIFLLQAEDENTGPFVTAPTLANLPAVQLGQVHGLGINSFRVDYYSGLEIVQGIVSKFSK